MALRNGLVSVLMLMSLGLGLVHSALAVPQGLTVSDWSGIQSQIRAQAIHILTLASRLTS